MTILSLKMWSPFSLWTLLQQHFIGIVRALFFIDSYYPFQVFCLPVFVVTDFEELFLFILLPHNHTNHEGLEAGVLTATSPGQYHAHALPSRFWASWSTEWVHRLMIFCLTSSCCLYTQELCLEIKFLGHFFTLKLQNPSIEMFLPYLLAFSFGEEIYAIFFLVALFLQLECL